jgi:G3E family GTPase
VVLLRPDAAPIEGAGFRADRQLRDSAWLETPAARRRSAGQVDAWKYRARRPFHPARLAEALSSGWAGVLRAKGFVWIASRGDERGVYLHAGTVWRLDGAGPWWASVPQAEWEEAELQEIRSAWDLRTGDRRQELVFVGIDLDAREIARDLDACLLDDRELAGGPAAWAALPDPLPSWDDDGEDAQEDDGEEVIVEAARRATS